MRILVTGAAGFIGWHLREVAARVTGDEVIGYDLPGQDIRHRAVLDRAIAGAGADAVINLAGVLGTGELLGSEHAAVEANITGAVTVMNACAAAGVPLVQIATGHRGQLNTYAITKACAEDLALARAQWRGDKIAVVRAYHVYGEHQKPPAPWGKAGSVRKILPAFACQALTGRPLTVYGDGEQVIDLVYAADVARILLDAVHGPYGEVTEAGTGSGTTVNACAQMVAEVAGQGATIEHVPMRAGEPAGACVVAVPGAIPIARHWPYRLPEVLSWYAGLLGFTGTPAIAMPGRQ